MHARYNSTIHVAKGCLALLGHHKKAAACGFLLGGGLLLTAGTVWRKHYSGSALIAFNPQTSGIVKTDSLNQRAVVTALLAQMTPQQDWGGVVSRFQLYPELVAGSGVAAGAKYLNSQVTMEQVEAPELGGEAVRIGYSGTDRNSVLGVTDAVAEGFTRSQPVSGSAVKPTTDEPLYAPVTLPSTPAVTASAATGKVISQERHSRSASAISAKVNADLLKGIRLKFALDQNIGVLEGLRKQRQAAVLQATPAPKAPASLERKPSAEEQRLRQDVAKAQRNLTELRQRYTEEYPDVLAAKDHVQDLQLDLSRIAALSPAPAKPQPAPQPERKASAVDPSIVAGQISQAEAAQAQLKQEIEENSTETLQLQTQLAMLAHSGADVASSTKAGLTEPMPEQTSDQRLQTSAPVVDNTATVGSAGIAAVGKGDASASIVPSPFFLVREADVTTSPWIFATQFLWPLSVFIGVLAAFLAAWLAEQRDPLIRNEGMLRHELPPSAVFLGGVPRIRHEVIVD